METAAAILLFAFGIIQVPVSADIIQLPGITAYFPVGTVLINFITSLIIAVVIHNEVHKITLPQFAIFSILIILQFLSL